jgi:hypothetical protein
VPVQRVRASPCPLGLLVAQSQHGGLDLRTRRGVLLVPFGTLRDRIEGYRVSSTPAACLQRPLTVRHRRQRRSWCARRLHAEEDSAGIVVASGSGIPRSTVQADSSAYAGSNCACAVLGEIGNHECICQYADGKYSSSYEMDRVGLPPLSGKPRTEKC